MVKVASVVIPVAPAHEHLVQQAVLSVEAQTVPCEAIVMLDTNRRGPAWARNRGIEKASTKFVTFLDADDLLMPDFLEKTLAAWQPDHYVYTWWWQSGKIYRPRNGYDLRGSWHLVTALVTRQSLIATGGFDETLPGGEDTDLYLKLTSRRYCGIEVPEPLVEYRRDGRRSKQFRENGGYKQTIELLVKRYGGFMGCCGGSTSRVPLGAKLENDVLAFTLWKGIQSQRGMVTGRRYRGGNGTQIWMDLRDLQARPELYRMAEQQEVQQPQAPTVSRGVQEVSTQANDALDFDSMTIAQLEAYADENNIDLGDATRKADIIAAIKSHLIRLAVDNA